MSCVYKIYLSKAQIKEHEISSKLVYFDHLSALKLERVALICEGKKEIDEGGGTNTTNNVW